MEKFLIAILGIVLTTVIVVAESAVVGWVVMWAFKALHHDVSAVPPLGFDASFLAAFAILTLARNVPLVHWEQRLSPLTIAELKARAAELEMQAERLNLDIPGVQQKRAWALRKRYTQQAADYRNLAQLAMGLE